MLIDDRDIRIRSSLFATLLVAAIASSADPIARAQSDGPSQSASDVETSDEFLEIMRRRATELSQELRSWLRSTTKRRRGSAVLWIVSPLLLAILATVGYLASRPSRIGVQPSAETGGERTGGGRLAPIGPRALVMGQWNRSSPPMSACPKSLLVTSMPRSLRLCVAVT